MKADKLILGNIRTLDLRNPIMKALTVKDGMVQYVGAEAIARKLCDENTEVIDYGDNFIYPGMMDAHVHGLLAGPRIAFFADLTPGESLDDYLKIIKDYIEEHPDNEFYCGAGWHEVYPLPSAKVLDEICADKPITLNSVDGHSMWMNTKSMELYGVDKACAEMWGHEIVRVYEDGTPTGYVSEGPTSEIIVKTNILSKDAARKAYLTWQEFAFFLGYTAVYEAGIQEPVLEVLRELVDEGKWKLRTYCGYMIDEREPDYVAKVQEAKALADKYNCEYLQIIGVKIFMDGVVEAHTAWTLEEYDDMPEYHGVKRFCDHDRTVELYKECARLGFNVHQHTVGDAAVKFALDCIEEAQIATGNMDMRNALAHLQMLTPEDVERLCNLNAIAIVAPLWMSRDESMTYYNQSIRYIGDRRTFYSYPLNSFINNNGVIAFHSDYPVSTEVSVPRSIYMACKRTAPDFDMYYQWNPEECISREAAIAGLTIGPAYSVKQEERLGKLMIGYVANMSVYDSDFLADELVEVANAKTVATIIDGEEVYRA